MSTKNDKHWYKWLATLKKFKQQLCCCQLNNLSFGLLPLKWVMFNRAVMVVLDKA